jgi:putative methionine-R-sulfoxide reductase with GAF domain
LKKEKSLEKAFQKLCNVQQAVAGALYKVSEDQKLELTVPFALSFPDSKRPAYKFGEGFVGQSAKDRKPIFIDDIPEHTPSAISGLGSSPPKFLSIIPLIQNETLVGVCELGTFSKVNEPEVLTKACEALAASMTPENGKRAKSKS